MLLSDPRGRFVSMPRDEPSFIIAPGEFGELGTQFLDGFERPHPEQPDFLSHGRLGWTLRRDENNASSVSTEETR